MKKITMCRWHRQTLRGNWVQPWVAVAELFLFVLSFRLWAGQLTLTPTDVNQTWSACARDDPLEVINFWCWSRSAYGFWITFPFSSPLWNRGFRRYRISHSHQPIFTKLGQLTDADRSTMNPQHFRSDPADIHIRIRITPEIRLRIPDHFRFTFRPRRSLR